MLDKLFSRRNVLKNGPVALAAAPLVAEKVAAGIAQQAAGAGLSAGLARATSDEVKPYIPAPRKADLSRVTKHADVLAATERSDTLHRYARLRTKIADRNRGLDPDLCDMRSPSRSARYRMQVARNDARQAELERSWSFAEEVKHRIASALGLTQFFDKPTGRGGVDLAGDYETKEGSNW